MSIYLYEPRSRFFRRGTNWADALAWVERQNGSVTKKTGRPQESIFPADIEQLCQQLESGAFAWQLAKSWDTTTPIIYHWYRKHRGMTLTEWRRKQGIDRG